MRKHQYSTLYYEKNRYENFRNYICEIFRNEIFRNSKIL